MIKYDNNTINKLATNATVNKMYYGGNVAYMRYYRLVPQNPCYDVIDSISSYTARTFSDVYDTSSNKWYKLNNADAYEEYGVYGESTASTETTYEGKLAKVGNYEYEFINGQWTNIGEVTATTATEWVDFRTLDFTRSYPSFRTVRINSNNNNSFYSIYVSTTPNTTTNGSNYFMCAQNSYSGSYFGTIGGTKLYYSATTEVSDGIYEYDLGKNYYLCGSDYNMNNYKTKSDYANFLYVSETVTRYEWPEEYGSKEAPPAQITASTLEKLYDYSCPYIGLIGIVGDKNYEFSNVDGKYKWIELVGNTIKASSTSAFTAYTIVDGNLITTYFDGETEKSVFVKNDRTEYTITKLFGSGSTLGEYENKPDKALRNVELDFGGNDIIFGSSSSESNGILYLNYGHPIGNVKIKCNNLTDKVSFCCSMSGLTSSNNTLIFDVNRITITHISFFVWNVNNYDIWFLSDNYVYTPRLTPSDVYHFRSSNHNNIFFTSTTPPQSDYSLASESFDTSNSWIYVPDSAINAYKNCTYFKNIASRIVGISTWTGDIPTEAQSKL
jgi:hypothetical protein